MSKRDFDEWFETMQETLFAPSDFVDFDKVTKEVEKIKEQLTLLNTLTDSEDLESDFNALLTEHHEILEIVPLLMGLSKKEIKYRDPATLKKIGLNFKDNISTSPKIFTDFLKESGLLEFIHKNINSSFAEYVLGVAVGLDSNARKNRGGHLMEDEVERYIKEAGFKREEYEKYLKIDEGNLEVPNKSYFKELNCTKLEIIFEWLDLSPITKHIADKRFDFILFKDSIVYAIEVNFYNSQGSKLNTVAGNYAKISKESKNINNFKYVWITDGINGWKGAKKDLQAAFNEVDDIYNLNDLKNGFFNKL